MKRNPWIALAMAALIFLSACGTEQNRSGGIRAEGQWNDAPSPAHSEKQPEGTGPGEAQNATEIQAVISKNCNYVYHMMAVSGCGYDNDYAARYKSLHPEADLQVLKQNEENLTVAGGSHQGDLYFLCVVLPASLDDQVSVTEYFESLADLFATGEVDRNYASYQEIYTQAFSSVADVSLESFREFYEANEERKVEIAEVAAIMHRNYAIYSDQVWEDTLAELSVIVDELNREFGKNDYIGKWEELLDTQYSQVDFQAVMCNSLEYGAQAIDISATKDVFYHSGDYESTARFISHEFGIYMLKDLLADTQAFQSYSTYELTEALAEYYNIVVCGGTDRNWNTEYIDFYRELNGNEPEITAAEMFMRAAEHYNIVA